MGMITLEKSPLRIDVDHLIDEVESSCVLYLPLYKLPGEVFYSRDRNRHQCVNTGSIWTPQGRSFDGDDNINCGLADALKIQNFTILYWVKQPATIVYQGCVGTAASSGLNGYRSGLNASSKLEVLIGDAAAYDQMLGTTVFDDNIWRLAGATVDASFLRSYVNGVAEGTPVARTKTITFSSTLKLGAWADLISYFTGAIGEVWIYNRALDPPEMRRNYLATKWRYR